MGDRTAASDIWAGDGHEPYTYDCPTGKRGYKSRAAAKRELKKHRRDNSAEVAAYECTVCDGWHLTSQPPRNPR